MSRIPATERRAALAHAAMAVIARDGVAAATTRAIVAEAGMPLASFHYAVGSRDELLSDVIELVVAGEGTATLGSLEIDAPDLRSAVRATFGAYLDLVRTDPAREQAMFELTQHALRTPALADLPRQQYAELPRARGAVARARARSDTAPSGACRSTTSPASSSPSPMASPCPGSPIVTTPPPSACSNSPPTPSWRTP